MCGIVGYVGNRATYPIIIKCSKRLEYRGYDSAGIALLNSGLQLVKTKGKIIAVVTDGDKSVKALADHIIEIPEAIESLTPILASVPLQLLAYHIAVMRGCNVDQPRNLAKSVTLE